jgi:DNA-binding LytR/AlgR family response regulator
MTKLSCLIVDDEPLALDLLERYIRRTPFLEHPKRSNNAIEALEILNAVKIDLLFLDIHMPELSGMEFSKMLGTDIKIVFTTAYSEYAIEGYKVNALDYLLKPFSYEEFLRAANKAKDWFEFRIRQPNTLNINDYGFIFVKSEYKQVKINLNEVLFFEGLKDYIKIYIKDQLKPIMTIMSLKSLEQILPASQFMRIHRSYIIALDKIQMVEQNQILINNKVRIRVADRYKKKFWEFVSGRSIS